MTVLKRVTQAEMKERTGFHGALGYTFPEDDEILIRKDLPKETEHKVLAHEEEHMVKGEEGPLFGIDDAIFGALISGGFSLFGADKSASASKSAANTAAAGSERELQFARESRDLARADQAPYREAGTTALGALMSLVGLGTGGGSAASQTPAWTGPNDNGPGTAHPRMGNNLRTGGGGGEAISRFRQSGYSPQSRYNIMNPAQDWTNWATQSRAMGGNMYNVNEMGPENVYSGGVLNRNPNPMTIAGQTGYVQPHGRALGGNMDNFPGSYMPPGSYDNKPNPPWIPGDQAQLDSVPGGQGANTTAINPETGYPNENPGGVEGGYQFQTEPGYQFRFEEGQRALDRGAAARGGLLSGGYARKAIRYGQGFASNEFSNVYNRISNIAGLGQTSATTSGNAALYGGAAMGNAASNAANASAYGQIGAGNAWANAGNQIAQLPWGDIFNKKTPEGNP